MQTEPADRRYAIWLSDPSFAAVEIARGIGYGAVVLDIEHGSFDLAGLERFVPFIRALGMEVLAKVLGPERGPIQQALDFGADTVVVPHIENAAHAKAITAFANAPTVEAAPLREADSPTDAANSGSISSRKRGLFSRSGLIRSRSIVSAARRDRTSSHSSRLVLLIV